MVIARDRGLFCGNTTTRRVPQLDDDPPHLPPPLLMHSCSGRLCDLLFMAIVTFAHLSITFFGFTKSAAQGCACLFLPLLYSIPYGIMNWGENKAPVKAIMMASMFIGFGAFLIARGDGFAKLQGLF